MITQYIFLNIFALIAYVLASPTNDLQLATTPITRDLKSVFIYDCEEEQITTDNEIIVVEGCGETEAAGETLLPASAEDQKVTSKDNNPALKEETQSKEETKPRHEPKTQEKENPKEDGCKKGNPGNHKCVGNAGENPNGKGNWGAGDKGKGDVDKDNGKGNGGEKGKGKNK